MSVNGISNEVKSYAPSQVKTQEIPVTSSGNEIVNAGNETKKQYLELAVGSKEKELKRLGLSDDEDGMVTKKSKTEMTAWERLQKEAEEKEEADKIKEKEAKKRRRERGRREGC